MKRSAILLGCVAILVASAFPTNVSAISAFNKQFKANYTDKDKDPDWYKTVSKAGCNVCHVKGHPDKKEARNEYGKAIHKYLKKDDFPNDYVKENPEEAAAKITAGLKKAGEAKSSDGKTFAEKIEAKELPATDWQYED